MLPCCCLKPRDIGPCCSTHVLNTMPCSNFFGWNCKHVVYCVRNRDTSNLSIEIGFKMYVSSSSSTSQHAIPRGTATKAKPTCRKRTADQPMPEENSKGSRTPLGYCNVYNCNMGMQLWPYIGSVGSRDGTKTHQYQTKNLLCKWCSSWNGVSTKHYLGDQTIFPFGYEWNEENGCIKTSV